MRPLKKKITVDCHGPIAANKKNKSSWEDVWLTWTGKPGRKKYHLGPCLMSKTALERDHEDNLKCSRKYPEIDWTDDLYQSELALKKVTLGEIHIEDPDSSITNIYTQKECIDRKEAERMIKVLLKLHGFNDVRFKWNRPKFIVIPM